jgi:hypothetical protein
VREKEFRLRVVTMPDVHVMPDQLQKLRAYEVLSVVSRELLW